MPVIKPFRGSLAVTFAAAFGAKIRDRGERYYSNGAVEIEYAVGNLLEATVTGGEMYDVSRQIDGEVLRVECTCPPSCSGTAHPDRRSPARPRA